MNAPIDPREISSVDDGLRSAREGGAIRSRDFLLFAENLGYEARMFNGEGSKLEAWVVERRFVVGRGKMPARPIGLEIRSGKSEWPCWVGHDSGLEAPNFVHRRDHPGARRSV